MKQYRQLIEDILGMGIKRSDRTGTGTIGIFGYQMIFDLEEGFPLVTLKKTNIDAVIHELLWFISGSTNINYLQDNNIHIWDEWADKDGNLGPVYGKQWRAWNAHSQGTHGIDQLACVIRDIKQNPYSRRHIVTAWNPTELRDMALPPCHCFFQFFVANDKLSCQLYQRSADCFLGVPFNIASYALLTHMVADVRGLGVGVFVHTFGDAHIYLNHLDQVELMLSREERVLPRLELMHRDHIDDFTFGDFKIHGYNPHPYIKAPVSV